MYCKYCGSKVEDGEGNFCKYCGAKMLETEAEHQQAKKGENPAQTYSTLGFIFSFMFALVGLILSAIALKKYKTQTNQDGKGMAVAGLVISIVSVGIVVIYFLFAFMAIATML